MRQRQETSVLHQQTLTTTPGAESKYRRYLEVQTRTQDSEWTSNHNSSTESWTQKYFDSHELSLKRGGGKGGVVAGWLCAVKYHLSQLMGRPGSLAVDRPHRWHSEPAITWKSWNIINYPGEQQPAFVFLWLMPSCQWKEWGRSQQQQSPDTTFNGGCPKLLVR